MKIILTTLITLFVFNQMTFGIDKEVNDKKSEVEKSI